MSWNSEKLGEGEEWRWVKMCGGIRADGEWSGGQAEKMG